MPVQAIMSCWLFGEGQFAEAEETLSFPGQTVFAQCSISHINWFTATAPSGWNANVQIKNYIKADGTVVDLSTDPKNNTFSDDDVVSVTFILQVINATVWSGLLQALEG